jgi:hypothetical protein
MISCRDTECLRGHSRILDCTRGDDMRAVTFLRPSRLGAPSCVLYRD